jgi:hypothetical protein
LRRASVGRKKFAVALSAVAGAASFGGLMYQILAGLAQGLAIAAFLTWTSRDVQRSMDQAPVTAEQTAHLQQQVSAAAARSQR